MRHAALVVMASLGLVGCAIEPDEGNAFGSGASGAGTATLGEGDGDGDGDSGGDGDGDPGGDGDGDGDPGDGDGDGDPGGDGDGDGDGDGEGEGDAVCGNGEVEPGEDCDGPTMIDNAVCSGQCAFECEADYGDCNDDFEGDGCESWLLLAENCGGCGVVCDPGSSCVQGACEITNTHGNDQEFPDGNVALAHNLLGGRISVPADEVLTHVGVYSKQAGPNGKFAVYEDAGGNPGALVAKTPVVPMELGMMEIPIGDPVAIDAGNYWIMGVFENNASVGLDTSDPNAIVKYVPFQFGMDIPDPFPAPTTYEGQVFNYFVLVQ